MKLNPELLFNYPKETKMEYLLVIIALTTNLNGTTISTTSYESYSTKDSCEQAAELVSKDVSIISECFLINSKGN